MKKGIYLSALLSLGLQIGFAQPKPIEKVEKKGNEFVIPFEKYKLPNGLTIIVHEDHSDPIVHVDVTYHVGSAREEIGRSGFAHFFEHMMFQGSDHVGDDQHFKIVSEAGGSLNGTTNTDRTNYFETLPSNQLETALWLEADRMGFLLDAVTQEKFENQRSTVKNERGQRYDNAPYGRVNEKINEVLYPAGHPYSWLTIGTLSDLDQANVNDLKKFFLRWYGPNNATLTVAGDVKTADVVKLAEKYFGPINAGPAVKPAEKTFLSLTSDRYTSYEDNIRFPLLAFSYPTVPANHADEPALDVLSDILGNGKTSLLYKNFVKAQIANKALSYHNTQELAGQFMLMVYAFPDKNLGDVEVLLRNTLKEFETRGVTDDDIEKFKATFETNMITSLSTVSGKASSLAAYQTFTGDANFIKKDMERYAKVTKEDVMRVYNKYIKGKGAVVLSVYPKGKKDIVAKPDNFTVTRVTRDAKASDETKDLVYNKAKDTFDRSKRPNAGEAPMVKVPEFWTESFSNGLKVMGSRQNEVPLVSMILSIEAAHALEAADKSKSGISQILSLMLDEATEKHSTEEINKMLEKLGSTINISNDRSYINVQITSPVKNLDKTLALVEEKLFHPKFDQADFDRVKKQQLEAIANQSTQPVTVANNVFSKLVYGSENIFGIPTIGTAESVKSIGLEDVKNYYKNNFSPSISNLVIVGDVDQKTALSKLNFLKNWTAKEVKIPAENPIPAVDKTRIYLVDKENAPQSEIRIGYPALAFDATGDYFKLGIMNYTLGGAFSSRINLNLREKRGWTYGARSGFSGDRYKGTFTASAGIKGVATDSSITEFMNEMKGFSTNGITDPELTFTRSSMTQSEALKYESLGQKAFFLKRMLVYNLNKDFVEKQNQIIKTIPANEINSLANKYLPTDKMVIVIVGDKKKVRPGLEKLGYEVIDLDKDGNKLPN